MATSRTGTTEWLNISRQVIRDAQDRGQTRCVYCPAILDYKNRRAPNGAQVDHIKADANGGSSEHHNLQVCCAHCNQSKSNRGKPKAKTIMAKTPLKTSRVW
ncbi:HNH endonuclease [Arthrobacter glacialis]|uniref:HNH endonuclease n=1 Tax=Arthrobacter glacialis TaxID=1664 RepID=UPI000CD42309|nr:hypothetical protein CVS28_12610 [Arthrobacter glacialis]